MKTKNRDKRLNARATEEEYEFILLTAQLKNYKSISEYIIDSLVYPQNLDNKKSQNMTYEVNKIGVNLNQISRKINQLELTDTEQIFEKISMIEAQLEEILRTYKKI